MLTNLYFVKNNIIFKYCKYGAKFDYDKNWDRAQMIHALKRGVTAWIGLHDETTPVGFFL